MDFFIRPEIRSSHENLSRKMGTKIMITNLCISKGSRYETKKNERGGIAHLNKYNYSNKN